MMHSFAEFLAEASEKDPYGFKAHAKTLKPHHYDALEAYGSGGVSGEINDKLRSTGGNHKFSPAKKLMVSHLDQATAHPIKKTMTLYRGFQSEKDPGHPKHHRPGSTHTDHGFTSTSHGMDYAAAIADLPRWNGNAGGNTIDHTKPAHIIRIHAPAGTHAHKIDIHFDRGQADRYKQHDGEKDGEIALRRGTTWKYGETSKVKHNGREYHVTDVHVLPRTQPRQEDNIEAVRNKLKRT